MSKGQERDINIRKVLTEDLNSARRNLKQLIEFLDSGPDDDIMDSIQRLLMDIRNLEKKITLSPVGKNYKLKKGDEKEILKNRELRTFDRMLSDKSSILAKATSTLDDHYLDGKVKNLPMELKKIRKYLSDLTNEYEHRDDIIKEVKF